MKHSEQHALQELNRLFIEALMELRNQGAIEQACKLAARGWSRLRLNHTREAERLNGVLHALTQQSQQHPLLSPSINLKEHSHDKGSNS
ncbi:MAG: hypothetical protein KGQ58_08170 [Proteobacteria bacterium]|nr:hypothetical protein [Pseudomonadota bacterium]MDE3208603.1 hypothetical protein [Pseudomonadota bacterium]